MKKHLLGVLGLFVVLAFAVSLEAQRGEWVLLGTGHVNGQEDHDTIRVGIADGKFRKIQLRVSGGSVEFDHVIVRFGNGSQEELPVHEKIHSGGRTRIIDLPGDQRIIQSIDMWYSQHKWNRLPKVTVFGIR
jgi:hypothetical protein